jgi:hypothetical protein
VIKWTGVAVVVRTPLAIAVTLLPDSGGVADERRLPATFSVLAGIVANIADVRTVTPARSVFLNDFNDNNFNDRFEPWLELLLKQTGCGGTNEDAHLLAACPAGVPKRRRLREEHRQVVRKRRSRRCRHLSPYVPPRHRPPQGPASRKIDGPPQRKFGTHGMI